MQLLIRTTRKLSATELGLDYAERARRILAEVMEADDTMANHLATPRGTLRLTAPLSFGVLHLTSLLTGFLTLHPGGYDWRFAPEPGKTFTDVGSAACH